MSWFSTILTGILVGALALDEFQYQQGQFPHAWQALLFWTTVTTIWIILIRALSTTRPPDHMTT
jgi:hypothetical protein